MTLYRSLTGARIETPCHRCNCEEHNIAPSQERGLKRSNALLLDGLP